MQYIYIKKSVPKKFLVFDDKLSTENYENQGVNYADYLQNKFVLLSKEQAKFHEEHPTASVKEVWDMKLKERSLSDAKMEMLQTISQYDISPAVNSFVINGEEAWIEPDKRTQYKQSIESAKLLEEETVSFFLNGKEYTAPVSLAEMMLARIQLYADKCYIVTKRHEAAVKQLDDMEMVDSYDYKVNYPDKLIFSL